MEKTVSCLILFNIEYNKLNKIYRNACDQNVCLKLPPRGLKTQKGGREGNFLLSLFKKIGK